MATIDLGPPRPTPRDLLEGLPRRVTMTLVELRLAAQRAGGAPLPFDLAPANDHAAGSDLEGRLGRSRDTVEDSAYAAAVAALREPSATLARRGLLVGPDDGVIDDGVAGALGLLAAPQLAVEIDVSAGGVQVKSWQRQSGEAVAALSTADGLVFELAWFPVEAWPDELARVAVVPEDLPLDLSGVPDQLDLPHELLDAAVEAVRAGRSDLVPVLAAQHRGDVTDGAGDRVDEAEVAAALGALATEARGRLRALVADVSVGVPSAVGVLAWTLVADGWRSLRAHQGPDRLRVEMHRAIPDDLGAALAPLLAEVRR